jgi:hypothetical protein
MLIYVYFKVSDNINVGLLTSSEILHSLMRTINDHKNNDVKSHNNMNFEKLHKIISYIQNKYRL